MKIFAINGSPRKNWNTSSLIKKVLEGAVTQDVETKIINLYELKYQGCISCFACKRKGGEYGKCAMKDDLSPVLEALKTADAIVFGSPIYFMNITSGMTAFLERFLFSNMIYSFATPTVFPWEIPSIFLYTMNVTEEQMCEFGVEDNLRAYQNFIGKTLGKPPKLFYAYNTYQFSDYDKYESSMFSEEEKAKYKAVQFPLDCQKAFNMGIDLADSFRS